MEEGKEEKSVSANETHFCNTCSLEYPTQDDLEEHNWSLLHHKKLDKEKGRDYVHKCTLCEEDIFGLLSYTKHIHSDDHQKKLQKWKTRNAIVNDEKEGYKEPAEDTPLLFGPPMPPLFGPPSHNQGMFGPRPNMPRNFRPIMPQRLLNRWHRPRFFPRGRPFRMVPFNRNPNPRHIPPLMFPQTPSYRFFEGDPFVARLQSNFRPQMNPLMPPTATGNPWSELSTNRTQKGIASSLEESSFNSQDKSSKIRDDGSHDSTENEESVPARDFIPLNVIKDTTSEDKAASGTANSSVYMDTKDSSFQGFNATRVMREKMKELKAKMSQNNDQNLGNGARSSQSDTASAKSSLLNISRESMSNTDDLAIEVPGSFEILSRESERLEAKEQTGSGDKGQESMNKSEYGKKLDNPFVGSKEEESLAHFVTENLWNKKDDLELEQENLSDLEDNTHTSNVIADKGKVRIARESKTSDKDVQVVSVKNISSAVQSSKVIADTRNLRLSNNGAEKSKSKVRKVSGKSNLLLSQTEKIGSARSDISLKMTGRRVEGSKSDNTVSISEKQRETVHRRSEQKIAARSMTKLVMGMSQARIAAQAKELLKKQQNEPPRQAITKEKSVDNNNRTPGKVSHQNIGSKNHQGTKGNSQTARAAGVCISSDAANILSGSVHNKRVLPQESIANEAGLESTRFPNTLAKALGVMADTANAGNAPSKDVHSSTPSSTNEPHSCSSVSLQSSIVSLDESLLSSNSTNQCEFRYKDGRRCPTSAELKFCPYHEKIVRNVFIHYACANPQQMKQTDTTNSSNESSNTISRSTSDPSNADSSSTEADPKEPRRERRNSTSGTAPNDTEQGNTNMMAVSDSDADIDHVRLQSRFKYINKVPTNPIRGVERTHLPPNIRKLLNQRYEAGKRGDVLDEPLAGESERGKETGSRLDLQVARADLVSVGGQLPGTDPVIAHGNQGNQRIPAEGTTRKPEEPQSKTNSSGTESVLNLSPVSAPYYARYTTFTGTNLLEAQILHAEKATSNSVELRHADSVAGNGLGSTIASQSKSQTLSPFSSSTAGKQDDILKVTEGAVLAKTIETVTQAVLSKSGGISTSQIQAKTVEAKTSTVAPAASKKINGKSISDLRSAAKRLVVESAVSTAQSRPALSECAGLDNTPIYSRPRSFSTEPSRTSVGNVGAVAKASVTAPSEQQAVGNKAALSAATKSVEISGSKPKLAVSTVSSTAVAQSSTGKKIGEAESRHLAKPSKSKSNLVDMRTLANLVLSSTIPAAASMASGRPESSRSTDSNVTSKARSSSVGSTYSPLDKVSNSTCVPQRPPVAKKVASSLPEKYQKRRSGSFDSVQQKHVNIGMLVQPIANAKTVSAQQPIKRVVATESTLASSDKTVNKSKSAAESSRPTNLMTDAPSSSTATKGVPSTKVGRRIAKAKEITTSESGYKTQATTLSNSETSKSTNAPLLTSISTASIPKTSSSAFSNSNAVTSTSSTSTVNQARVLETVTTICQSGSELKQSESMDAPGTSSPRDLSHQRNLLRDFFDNLRKKKQAPKLSLTVPASTEHIEYSGVQSNSQSRSHLIELERARPTKATAQAKEIEVSQRAKSKDLLKRVSSESWKQGKTGATVSEGGPNSIEKRSTTIPLVSNEESARLQQQGVTAGMAAETVTKGSSKEVSNINSSGDKAVLREGNKTDGYRAARPEKLASVKDPYLPHDLKLLKESRDVTPRGHENKKGKRKKGDEDEVEAKRRRLEEEQIKFEEFHSLEKQGTSMSEKMNKTHGRMSELRDEIETLQRKLNRLSTRANRLGNKLGDNFQKRIAVLTALGQAGEKVAVHLKRTQKEKDKFESMQTAVKNGASKAHKEENTSFDANENVADDSSFSKDLTNDIISSELDTGGQVEGKSHNAKGVQSGVDNRNIDREINKAHSTQGVAMDLVGSKNNVGNGSEAKSHGAQGARKDGINCKDDKQVNKTHFSQGTSMGSGSSKHGVSGGSEAKSHGAQGARKDGINCKDDKQVNKSHFSQVTSMGSGSSKHGVSDGSKSKSHHAQGIPERTNKSLSDRLLDISRSSQDTGLESSRNWMDDVDKDKSHVLNVSRNSRDRKGLGQSINIKTKSKRSSESNWVKGKSRSEEFSAKDFDSSKGTKDKRHNTNAHQNDLFRFESDDDNCSFGVFTSSMHFKKLNKDYYVKDTKTRRAKWKKPKKKKQNIGFGKSMKSVVNMNRNISDEELAKSNSSIEELDLSPRVALTDIRPLIAQINESRETNSTKLKDSEQRKEPSEILTLSSDEDETVTSFGNQGVDEEMPSVFRERQKPRYGAELRPSVTSDSKSKGNFDGHKEPDEAEEMIVKGSEGRSKSNELINENDESGEAVVKERNKLKIPRRDKLISTSSGKCLYTDGDISYQKGSQNVTAWQSPLALKDVHFRPIVEHDARINNFQPNIGRQSKQSLKDRFKHPTDASKLEQYENFLKLQKQLDIDLKVVDSSSNQTSDASLSNSNEQEEKNGIKRKRSDDERVIQGLRVVRKKRRESISRSSLQRKTSYLSPLQTTEDVNQTRTNSSSVTCSHEQLLECAQNRLLSMNGRETSDTDNATLIQGMTSESGDLEFRQVVARKRTISTDSSQSSSRTPTPDADGISYIMNTKLKKVRQNLLMDSAISPTYNASIDESELVFTPHNGSVTCLQVYKGFLYSSSQDRSIRVHDAKTALRLKADINNKKVINRIEIDRQGVNSTLFAGCNDNKVRFYNLYTLCLKGEILFDGRVLALHAAFGNLYVGLSHGEVSIVSSKTKQISASFYCGDGDNDRKAISCIASANFSSEGKSYNWIMIGTFNNTISVYDPYQCITVCGCLCAKKFSNHDSPVLCMEVRHDRLYSGSTTGNVLVHDLKELRYLKLFCRQNGAIVAMKLVDNLLVTASTDKLIRCYDIQKGTIVKVYGGHKAMVYCLASDSEGARIYSGSKDGDVRSNKIQLESQAKCQWEGCGLPFGLTNHLKLHILIHHISPNTRSFNCKWKSCTHVYPSRIKEQYLDVDVEHVEHHMREPSS